VGPRHKGDSRGSRQVFQPRRIVRVLVLVDGEYTVAPFLSIAGLKYFPPFNAGYNGPFPIFFDQSGVDTADLGAGPNPLSVVPNGSYHVTNITFGIANNAPVGTYTLHITTGNPRPSTQTDANFNDVPFPQISFVFNVVL
jgi:hypothetical protein